MQAPKETQKGNPNLFKIASCREFIGLLRDAAAVRAVQVAVKAFATTALMTLEC